MFTLTKNVTFNKVHNACISTIFSPLILWFLYKGGLPAVCLRIMPFQHFRDYTLIGTSFIMLVFVFAHYFLCGSLIVSNMHVTNA